MAAPKNNQNARKDPKNLHCRAVNFRATDADVRTWKRAAKGQRWGVWIRKALTDKAIETIVNGR